MISHWRNQTRGMGDKVSGRTGEGRGWSQWRKAGRCVLLSATALKYVSVCSLPVTFGFSHTPLCTLPHSLPLGLPAPVENASLHYMLSEKWLTFIFLWSSPCSGQMGYANGSPKAVPKAVQSPQGSTWAPLCCPELCPWAPALKGSTELMVIMGDSSWHTCILPF